jgi:hypothetical protein
VWQWFTYRGPGKWPARAVARRLGVSHTYVQKLVRRFVADPGRQQRGMVSELATFEQLSRAQEETRHQRERGWLRPPRRWKRVEVKIGNQVIRDVVRTKASVEREQQRGCNMPVDVPIWATGRTNYSAEMQDSQQAHPLGWMR